MLIGSSSCWVGAWEWSQSRSRLRWLSLTTPPCCLLLSQTFSLLSWTSEPKAASFVSISLPQGFHVNHKLHKVIHQLRAMKQARRRRTIPSRPTVPKDLFLYGNMIQKREEKKVFLDLRDPSALFYSASCGNRCFTHPWIGRERCHSTHSWERGLWNHSTIDSFSYMAGGSLSPDSNAKLRLHIQKDMVLYWRCCSFLEPQGIPSTSLEGCGNVWPSPVVKIRSLPPT